MDKIYKYVTNYIGKFENRMKWKSMTWTILVLATFLTTYFLILPAITVTDKQADEAAIRLEDPTTEENFLEKVEETDHVDSITSLMHSEETVERSEQTKATTEATTEIETTSEKGKEETHFDGALTYRGSDYKVRVTIPKEAKIPSTVQLVAEEIKEEEAEYHGYKEKVLVKVARQEEEIQLLRLYDIRLLVDEQEVEPQASVKVEVSYDEKLDAKDEDLKIVHFKDDGQTEVLKSKATKETKNTDSDIAFKTDSFSIYAIVQNGKEVPRHTYKFQNADGSEYKFINKSGDEISEQIIKNGEELHGVGIPITAHGQHFNGWFIWNEDQRTLEEAIKFDEPITVNESKTIYIRPSMGNMVYLTVYDDEDGKIILEKEQLALNGGSVTEDLSKFSQVIKPPTSTQVLVGWSLTPHGTLLQGGVNATLSLSQDTKVYPIFGESKRLEFYTDTLSETDSISNGAPYIPPKLVVSGETVTQYKPEDPKRYGYTFGGWYDTKPINGQKPSGNSFNFDAPLTTDKQLYAYWIPDKASYTVVYWLQRATDSKNATKELKTYDYAGQRSVASATVGSTVSVTTADKNGTHITGFVPAGFEYTTDRGETTTTVKADGSTVLNVYFNRRLITMKFYDSASYIAYNSPIWNSNDRNLKVLTGLYGTSLESNNYTWPNSGTNTWRYYEYTGSDIGMTYLGEFVLPEGTYPRIAGSSISQEIRLFKSGTKAKTIHFYKQRVDGSYAPIWSPDDTGVSSSNSTTFTFSEKYNGFNVHSYIRYDITAGRYVDNQWRLTSSGNNTSTASGYYYYNNYYITNHYDLHVRYERKKFKLDFRYPETNASLDNFESKEVLYEENLSKFKPDTTTIKPTPPKPGYEWDGKWYKDQTLTQEFDWNDKMPDHDLVVYPGFRKIKYNIVLDPNGGELSGSQDTHFTLYYGDSIPEYDNMTRNYIEDPNGSYYYRKDTVATLDIANDSETQHAHYTTNPAESNVNPNQRYRADKDAYHLIGWYVVGKDGNLERPYNFSGAVTSNLTLRAEWRRTGEYKVVYSDVVYGLDLNPIQKDGTQLKATNLPNDLNKYDDKSHAELERRPTSPEGYRFRGWLYDGKIYNPHDTIIINALKADGNKTLTVYPVYKPVESIQVETTHITYDGNGGARLENGQKVTQKTYDKLPVNTIHKTHGDDFFERVGYDLIGWHTVKADAERGNVEYRLGQDVGLDNKPDASNTLYAVWKPKEYTVTVIKKVIGNDDDKQKEFKFDPSTNLQQGNFALRDSVTNNNEKKVFTKVPYGTVISIDEQDYTEFSKTEDITHSKPASGEQPWTDRVVNLPQLTVDGDIDIVFTNTRNMQQVVLKKVSVENINTSLSGAEFNIYKVENGQKASTPLYTKVTSNDAGIVVNGHTQEPFFNLPVGSYLITETKAPDGYNLEKADMSLEVTATGASFIQNGNAAAPTVINTPTAQQFEFKITNSKGAELPSTGGIGKHLYLILGMLLALPAGLLLYKKHKLMY
ncbi:InlB B-repeat-containing protein [Streptococcus sp. S784/96/1]|uniref:InlB B-repeat-containing protein n=1 Tax=Streptococcus sp. S784/96/1 TaxID=2653499 RepID=UPI001EE47759|nr:InlB B-repeat-containing protein [Streptococcus sp. S784/96/1]